MSVTTTTSILCLSLAVVCSTTAAQQPPEVVWANDRLSVRATDAALADVVSEVARVTGIELVGREKLSGHVSINFADQPLEKALAALFEAVNYSIQERAAADGVPRQLTVRILSMIRGSGGPMQITGPLASPALDALVAEAITDHDDQVEVDADDDPDYYDDIRAEKLEASRLAAEGAFGPKADVASLIKLTENYNDYIRLEALKALATRPLAETLVPLTKALGDEHWDVRNVAIEVLSRARDQESLLQIGHLLVKAVDREAKVDALRVIAARAQPQALVHLQAYLKTPAGIEDALLRAAAQQMINELEWRAQAARGERR